MRTDFLHVLGIIAASAILEALCPPSDYSENIPFVIETKGATGVGSYEATLNAYIDITGINFNEVSYGFFWGTSYDSLDYEIKCESTRTLSNPKFSYSAQLATLDPKTKYWFKAYIKFGNNIYYGDTKSFSTTAFKMVAVDLGLSVKWASCNLGATSPSASGDYYAWGETEPKIPWGDIFEDDWKHYKWCKGSKDKLTKYCSVIDEWAGAGMPDNKTVLEPADDAAHVILGSKWRMPTAQEWSELREKCTWERKGDDGYVVTSKINGNSIFLPVTRNYYDFNRHRYYPGCGYWSSSSGESFNQLFSKEIYMWQLSISRADPLSIRPVYDIPLSLNTSALLLYKGEKKKLTATVSWTQSDNKEVRWVSSDTSVAIVNSEGVVSAVSAGTALITVNTVVGGHAASCSVTVSDKPLAVDLGLTSGVKWASFNIGASLPEEFGDYYAWGEKEPYYKKLNPLTWNSKTIGYNKKNYVFHSNMKYDVAHLRLGGKWRMPTYEEWKELKQQCTWTLTICNGVKGYLVKSKRNGNSIFLPAAGYFNDVELLGVGSGGCYWSSSLFFWDVKAFYESFDIKNGPSDCCQGLSVRPVCLEDILPTQVSLNSSDLSLITGDKRQLTATVIPAEATNKSVTWVSSNSRVVSVNSDGVISAHAAGTATITVTTILGGLTATCSVTVSGKPVAVDLGLPSGIKWASFNLGASAPEEYGDYYAWGEPEPYYISQNPLTWKVGKTDGYNWSSYNWWNGSSSTLTKYNKKDSKGVVDNKTMLEEMDDAAHIRLGDRWRIPSAKEWKELKKRCKWIRTNRNNVSGYEVTGPNGNSIFLPATGLRSTTDLSWSESGGYYWSSSLSTDSRCAWCLYFYLNDVYVFKNYGRSLGFAIRPVSD